MKKIIRRQMIAETHPALANLPVLLRQVYATRGVTSSVELERGFDRLLPYETLMGISEAVELLARVIVAQKKILIVGDFDADGATSTALAIRVLRSFGAGPVTFLVPNRFAYGYGLSPELVEVAKTLDPALIITVDNGIANHAGVEAAKSYGIQVLITDHHLPATSLPPADAIVNPNQVGDKFPSKNLAGVGVIFYVMLALRRHLQQQGWFAARRLPEPVMSQFLDLVALGTIADLVPLDHNNRILVHQGLRRIRAGQCSLGIIALLEVAGREYSRVTASDLGFVVAARLNAAGRMDDMSLGIETLTSDDSVRAREMATQLDQLNQERRAVEKDMQHQALEIVKNLQTRLQGDIPKGLCLFDASWHQGVIGILASRIKERFHRPVIVLAPGMTGETKGSARSIPGVHIRDVLAQVATQYPQLILKFGGHAMAAGLTIKNENVEKFSAVFDEIVSAQLSDAMLQQQLLSDGALGLEDFNLETASLLREGGPWGQAFPEPLFDDTFTVLEQRIVGSKHLKMSLSIGERVLDAIAFFVDLKLWPNHHCQKIHAAYRLDINEYRGQSRIQLIIEQMEAV